VAQQAFLFFLLSRAKTGPVHDPYGCWLGPITMLIIIDVAYMQYLEKARGEEEERRRLPGMEGVVS